MTATAFGWTHLMRDLVLGGGDPTRQTSAYRINGEVSARSRNLIWDWHLGSMLVMPGLMLAKKCPMADRRVTRPSELIAPDSFPGAGNFLSSTTRDSYLN